MKVSKTLEPAAIQAKKTNVKINTRQQARALHLTFFTFYTASGVFCCAIQTPHPSSPHLSRIAISSVKTSSKENLFMAETVRTWRNHPHCTEELTQQSNHALTSVGSVELLSGRQQNAAVIPTGSQV